MSRSWLSSRGKNGKVSALRVFGVWFVVVVFAGLVRALLPPEYAIAALFLSAFVLLAAQVAIDELADGRLSQLRWMLPNDDIVVGADSDTCSIQGGSENPP